MKQRHAHKRHFLVVGGRRAASSRGEFTNGLGRVLVLRGGHEPQQSGGQILIAQRVRPARQQVSFGQSTDPVPGLRDRIARTPIRGQTPCRFTVNAT